MILPVMAFLCLLLCTEFQIEQRDELIERYEMYLLFEDIEFPGKEMTDSMETRFTVTEQEELIHLLSRHSFSEGGCCYPHEDRGSGS